MTQQCDVEGCEREQSSRGWCRMHYKRWRRNGTTDGHPSRNHPKTCVVEGCDRDSDSRGWCAMHYQRWLKDGDPGEPTPRIVRGIETCGLEGCSRDYFGLGWCRMHYERVKAHGDPGPVESYVGQDEISYPAAHDRVRTQRGVPRQCEHCGLQDQDAHYECALNWDCEPEVRWDDASYRERPLAYSPDPSDYIRLCGSCHREFDSEQVMEAPDPRRQPA